MIPPVIRPIDTLQLPTVDSLSKLKLHQLKQQNAIKNIMVYNKSSKNPSHK